MASSKNTSPKLDSTIDYETWEQKIKIWQLVTDLPAVKQGPMVVLALSGKAEQCALEIPIAELSANDGVTKILDKLGKVFKKDSVDAAYEAFDQFINLKRLEGASISSFVNEFERLHNKAKVHGCDLSSPILAYFLLNQANLSESNKQLARATVSKLEFEDMKSKLLKIFGTGGVRDIESSLSEVKIEDANVVDEMEDVYYGDYLNRDWQSRYPRRFPNSYRGNRYSSRGYVPNRGASSQSSQWRPGRGRANYGGKYFQEFKQGKNRCSFCQSIYHLLEECPERFYHEEPEEDSQHDIVLYQSNLITVRDYDIFVAESSTSAILDCGASATVAGKAWFQSYCDGLSEKQQKKITYSQSSSSFKFGSGDSFPSLFKVEFPAKIGSHEVAISADVVETQIPLLLSKSAMKKADTEINFQNDTVRMFGEEQDVALTQSGHYALPLNNSRSILKDVLHKKSKIVLLAQNQDDKKIARKLHAQFGHPDKSQLLKLLERAGRLDNPELLQAVDEVYKECDLCKRWKKPSPRPIVGLPHAQSFNETVAMDLKFFEGKIILHLIDHLTRFSMATVCKSKDPKEIISGIFRCWVGIFGAPKKFLSDNGGEFANRAFIDLAEAVNIRVLTTAAESPWSNGLVERHNAVLGEILHKVLSESKGDFEMALAWAINAKNSLANIHGFAPVQLALGYLPSLPNVMTDKLPALEEREAADVIMNNLECIKLARKAFVEAESSERIKRALRHNVRPSVHQKFFTGDIVYYKRKDLRKWQGPGKVIGHESSNILIKHGAQYVRVHACRVMLLKSEEEQRTGPSEEQKTGPSEDQS